MSTAAAIDELFRHGGRVAVASRLRPNAPRPWIDLSAAINPNPYPAPRASALARARLPDPQELWQLEITAARTFGVEDPHRVLATSGSESVLRLLPHVLPDVFEASIVWPTYSSHIDSWQKLGVPIGRIYSVERASPEPGALVILVNPSSLDGSVTGREQLIEAHDKVAMGNGFLLVDEAFVDATPACSVADLAGSPRCPRLLVLRSFGKFYGLAGLRLGFVIGAANLIGRIRSMLGEWPVAVDAITAGLAAYTDALWAERARLRLRSAARKLDALLMRSGFSIVGGTSLFRLAQSDIASARFKQLLDAGILARPFNHATKLLRFGLPHGDGEWRRLRDTLRA